MNISSIVVKVLHENSEKVIQEFEHSDCCEFHLYENGNIIVTIEGKGVSEEIAKLKQIEKTEHVISASLVYSYVEDELEMLNELISKNEKLPDWLNKENIDLKEINYSGDVNKYIK